MDVCNKHYSLESKKNEENTFLSRSLLLLLPQIYTRLLHRWKTLHWKETSILCSFVKDLPVSSSCFFWLCYLFLVYLLHTPVLMLAKNSSSLYSPSYDILSQSLFAPSRGVFFSEAEQSNQLLANARIIRLMIASFSCGIIWNLGKDHPTTTTRLSVWRV